MPTQARSSWRDWITAMSPVAVLIGAAMAVGGNFSEVKDHERRIEVLEQSSRLDKAQSDDKLNTIDVRTARIEAKLEVLSPKEPLR